MFEVTQNNQQPEKKSFGKFGIFLVIFAFLCVAGFLYYYFSKSESTTEVVPAIIPKTEKQKVEADMELIKQGYVKSVSGKIKEISDNKDKITIITSSISDPKEYVIAINNKTTFFKTVPAEEKKEIEVEGEIIDISEDKKEEVTASELKVGYLVEAILPKFVKIEEEINFIAIKILMTEEIKEEGMEEEINSSLGVSVESNDTTVKTNDGNVSVETNDASVKTTEDGNVKVETPNASVDTSNLGF